MFDFTGVQEQLSLLMVFMEGLLSFFSPCVLPLLPIYMGYLTASQQKEIKQRRVFFMTLMFVVGIFSAILLFHAVLSIFHSVIATYVVWITRIAGVLIIALGVYQLGFFHIGILERARQLPWKKKDMNVVNAFLLGFVFSFAWTPCIGPALTSILLFATHADTFMNATLLVMVYALGFCIPFLLVGAFTQKLLSWLKTHAYIMNYTIKIGAVILIIMGGLMVSGKLNIADTTTDTSADQTTDESQNAQVIDFSATDQNGNIVSLSDYRGKVVFLNFWATWCPPCQSELPHVQELYDKYKDRDDVAVLTLIHLPGEKNGEEGVMEYITTHGYDFPVLLDNGKLFQYFAIASYPTTFMIDAKGAVYGYVAGALSYEMMEDMIAQTKEAKQVE